MTHDDTDQVGATRCGWSAGPRVCLASPAVKPTPNRRSRQSEAGWLDCGLRLAVDASMPTNHATTSTTRLSARLSRLAVEAQRIADQLAARPLDGYEAELALGLPSFQLAKVVEQLEDAIFSAAWEAPTQRARDLAIARAIAAAWFDPE